MRRSPTIDIPVLVTDPEGLSTNDTVTLTVSNVNEAPVLAVPTGATVAENAAGVQVAALCAASANAQCNAGIASDVDADVGPAGKLSYSILALSGTHNTAAHAGQGRSERSIVDAGRIGDYFAIDACSGCVSVAAAGGGLNYEEFSTFELTLGVTDGEFAVNDTALVTVTDVNEAPRLFVLPQNDTFAAERAANVAENTQAGVVAGHFYACDPDHGATFSFSIPRGTTTTVKGAPVDLADMFALVAAGSPCSSPACLASTHCATIQRVQLLVAGAGVPNYCTEKNKADQLCDNVDNAYAVPVAVADAVTPSLHAKSRFAITKLNLEYPPAIDNAAALRAISFSEYANGSSATGGAPIKVAQVTASDQDKDPLSYHMSLAFADMLYVDAAGGVYLNGSFAPLVEECGYPRCSCAIDFECAPAVQVAVTVSDALFHTEANLTLNLVDVDEPPFFTAAAAAATLSVPERSAVGTAVAVVGGAVAAVDLDQADNAVAYSLSGPGAARFAIDAATAALTVAVDSPQMDFETEPEYEVTVTATSGPASAQQTDKITYHIGVVDVNEAPTLAPTHAFAIGEDARLGARLSPALAGADVDGGAWGELAYTIEAQSAAPLDTGAAAWAIGGQSGVLELVAPLDYERAHTYALTVRATDGGGLQVETAVTITVGDVHDVTLVDVAVQNATGGWTDGDFALGTGGAQRVKITGTNLVPVWAVDSTALTASYASGSDGRTHNATSCAVVKATGNTELVCTTAAGAGVGHTWTVLVPKQAPLSGSWSTTSEFTTSYAEATLSAVAAAPLRTAGGLSETVTLTGANLGGTLDTAVSAEIEYAAGGMHVPSCKVTKANAEIECAAVAGAGTAHAWKVTVGGQRMADFASQVRTSYAPPSVTAVAAGEAVVLKGKNKKRVYAKHGTPGGEAVVLQGLNFGPAKILGESCARGLCYLAEPVVSYLASATLAADPSTVNRTAAWFEATGCAITTDHTTIRCLTAPGVGKALRWRVHVGGQMSAPSAATTDYEPPAIARLEGTATDAAILTDGGQQISIRGTNLGPTIGTFAARYGETGEELTANDVSGRTSCVMSRPHEQVDCITIPGTGQNLAFSVVVGAQRSLNSADVVSYGQPVLHAITDAAGKHVSQPTGGGMKVILNGRNFGPASLSAEAYEAYGMSQPAYMSPKGRLGDVTYGECDKRGNCRNYTAADCNITAAHTQIACWSVAGVGSQQAWVVDVAGQKSTNPTTDYEPPTIYAIRGEPSDTLGGTPVTISGANFGLTADQRPGAVTYGLTGTEYVATGCVVTRAHAELVCKTSAGWGTDLMWRVSIGGQLALPSPLLTTRYAEPVIESASRTSAATGGGSVVTVRGRNFGPPGQAKVRFTNPKYTAAFPAYTGPILRVVQGGQGLGSDANTLNFTVPEGYGEEWLTVLVGDPRLQWPLAESAEASAVVIRYNAPVIERVVRDYDPALYKDVLHLYGRDFGPARDAKTQETVGAVALSLKEVPTQCDRVEWTHSHVACYIDLITQGNVSLQVGPMAVPGVSVSNQISFDSFQPQLGQVDTTCKSTNAARCQFYTYECAAGARAVGAGCTTKTSLLAPTQGGGLLRLAATNFGRRPKITVGGRECLNPVDLKDANSQFSPEGNQRSLSLQCDMPEGQGVGAEILLFREGQSQSSVAQKIDFMPPTVDWAGATSVAGLYTKLSSATKLVVSTQGVTSLKLNGINMGVDGADITLGAKTSAACTLVSQNHSQIVLDVPPGVGTGHELTVDVGGNVVKIALDYASPSIGRVRSRVSQADGALQLVLEGENFGLEQQRLLVNGEECRGAQGVVSVIVADASEVALCKGQAFPTPRCDQLHNVLVFEPRACGSGAGNSSYALDAVEGYAFTLETGAQAATYRSPSVASVTVTAAAGAQLLQGQQGAADAADARYGVDVAQNKMRTAGGGTLKLDGADFHWATTVTVGGAACTDVKVARPANRSLTCTYPAGVGTEREIVVTAGELKSKRADAPFSYLPPAVTTATAPAAGNSQFAEFAGGKIVGASTAGATLTLDGDNFGAGVNGADVPAVFLNAALSAAGGRQMLPLLSRTDTELSFALPSGFAGAGHALSLTVGGQLLTVPLDFAPPTVTAIAPNHGPTNGGTLLTLSGTDFARAGARNATGGVAAFGVTVGGRVCVVASRAHEQIVCDAPEWRGAKQAVVVDTAAQKSANPGVVFDYDKPVISGVLPQTGPTSGRATSGDPLLLTLTGLNFGNGLAQAEGALRLQMQRPTLFATAGASMQWNTVFDAGNFSWRFVSAGHTSAVFKLPADYGRGAPRRFKITVGGQASEDTSAAASVFQYAAPAVALVKKTILRTDGNGENGAKAVITITGSSFGKPEWDGLGAVDMGKNLRVRISHTEPAPTCMCVNVASPCQHDNDGSCIKRVAPSGQFVATGGACSAGSTDCHTEARVKNRKFWSDAAEGICEETTTKGVTAGCRECKLVSVGHDAITCEPGAGQGTLAVAVIRTPESAQNETAGGLCQDKARCAAANMKTLPYDTPLVSALFGRKGKRPVARGDQLTITGENFGNVFSEVEVALIDEVNNYTDPCAQATWVPRHPTDATLDKPYITCKLPRIRIGYRNLSILVAEQRVVYSRNDQQGGRRRNLDNCTSCMAGTHGPCMERKAMTCHALVPTLDKNGVHRTNKKGKLKFECPYTTALQTERCSEMKQAPGGNQAQAEVQKIKKVTKLGGRRRLKALSGALSADMPAPEVVPTGGFLLAACDDASFGQLGETCQPCPVGADCSDTANFDGSTFTEPEATPGFFYLTVQPTMRSCVQPERSQCAQFLPCDPPTACMGDNACAKGYIGSRCGTCSKGYYRLSGECAECPKCAKCAFIFFILFAATLCAGGHFLAKKKVKLNMLSIFIDYFQIMSILAMSNTINWPYNIKQIFNVLSFFNLNLDLMAPECSYPKVPYTVKWSMIMALPIFACGFFLMVHMGVWAKKRFIEKRTKDLHRHIHLMIGTSLIAFYYFYLYLTKTALDIFNCSPTTPPEFDQAGKEIEYLEVTFAQCGEAGGVQMQLVGPAACFFALYSMGFPAVVGALLYKNRLKCKEDQLLRAKRTGTSRATNPNCWDFRKKYHKIYEMYKPQYYFWAAMIMGRKLLIACAGLMFRRSPVFLLAFSLLTLFVSYACQVRCQPFMHDAEYASVVEAAEREADRAAKRFGNREVDLSGGHRPSMKGTKKVQLGSERSAEDLEENALGFRQSIYNYNTIESTLLFCAILIVLSGLMFTSDAIKPDSNWERGLLLWTTVILLFSICFFFAVVGTEIAVGLGIWDHATAKKKLGIKEEEESSDSDSDDDMTMAGNSNPLFHAGGGGGGGASSGGADATPMSHIDSIKAAKAKVKADKSAVGQLKQAGSAVDELQATVAAQKAEIMNLQKAAAASKLSFAHGHGSGGSSRSTPGGHSHRHGSGKGSARTGHVTRQGGDATEEPIAHV